MAHTRGGGPQLSAGDPPADGDATDQDVARAIGHALLRSGGFGLAVVGARDLRLVDANPALAALTGQDRRALIGRPLDELLVGPTVATLAAAVARGDGGVTLAAVTAPTAAQPSRAVDVTVQPLAADGSTAVLVVRGRDPTTEALHDSERRYRSIVEHAYEGIWLLDVDARTTLVNRRMSDLLGYTPEEMVGRHLFDFMDDVGRAQATRNLERRAAGLAEDHEFRFVRRDGSDLWTICSTAPLQDDAGGYHGALAMVLDITERRRAEEASRRLEAQMLETQKLESLGVLAGGIAHDFNNILTGILGNASLGLAVVRPGEPVADCLREIVEAATHAAELCRHMLAYSGKGRFVVERIDLGGVVESTAPMLHVSISKQASLRLRLARGLPPVEIDVAQIRQVIMNLVINASEALGDQRGEIDVRTAPRRIDRAYLERTHAATPLPEGDYVLLEVTDTGAGMTAETRARIFDPFFTTKFTGRGLGLAAVLGIVRGHRGAITVASEPGRGTTFQVLLPAAAGATPTPSPAVTAVAAPWQGAGTVLLVDDEAGVRAVARRVLRWLGFDVVLAVDGDEAVAAFTADPDRFAVVLLDLTMPGRDGVQTFAALRALRPAVRVVLMSGYNEQDALTRFTGQGLASFVQKPFTAEALRAILQQVLDPDRAPP